MKSKPFHTEPRVEATIKFDIYNPLTQETTTKEVFLDWETIRQTQVVNVNNMFKLIPPVYEIVMTGRNSQYLKFQSDEKLLPFLPE